VTIAIRRYIRIAGLLAALLVGAVLHAQEESLLKLSKGPQRPVAENVYEKILSIALLEGEIEATFISFGKAHPLSGELLEKVKASDRKLHRKAESVKTAFKLAQGNREFYVRGFDSINVSRLQAGKRVKCRVVLIEARTAEAVFYVPLIRSIETL
jgi:hypothetical protein